MAEGQGASGAGAPTDAQDQRSTSSDDSSTSGAATSQTSDIANPEAKRYADEAAAFRTQLKQAQAELKKLQDASMSADQKRERDYTDLQTRATEFELQVQRLHLENAGLRLAPSLGIADPAAALALVQVEHAHEITYGDDGRPQNLDALLKQVIKDHPALAANGQAQRGQAAALSAGATNPGRQAGNAGLTRELIEQMTPQQLKARWPEIQAWKKQYDQQP